VNLPTSPLLFMHLGAGVVTDVTMVGIKFTTNECWVLGGSITSGTLTFTFGYVPVSGSKEAANFIAYPGAPHYVITEAMFAAVPCFGVVLPFNITVSASDVIGWKIDNAVVGSAFSTVYFEILTTFWHA
jgi:hypothetical protein